MGRMRTADEDAKDRELCRWAFRMSMFAVFAVVGLGIAFAYHVDPGAASAATRVVERVATP